MSVCAPLQKFLARAQTVCSKTGAQAKAKYGSRDPWTQCNDMLFEYEMMSSLGFPSSQTYTVVYQARDGDDVVSSEWALGIALTQIST